MRCVVTCGLVIVIGSGCGKQVNPAYCRAHPEDVELCGSTGPDAPMGDTALPGPNEVAHLAPATEAMLTSTATLVIDQPTLINTSTGVIMPALTAGTIVLPSVPQVVGPNVMVIQAASIRVDAVVAVVGDRPLLLVATTTIAVNDDIDASANRGTRGPGGHPAAMGLGAGNSGLNGSGNSDSGGAGASFGSPGGRGGSCAGQPSPVARTVYGSPATLEGGSGGGNGSGNGCEPSGGAGGGALQLSARTSITISSSSVIDVGGGGGQRGLGTSGSPACNSDGASGGGGGSGGMIFLEAPMLLGTGTLVGNGGGGGGSASSGGVSAGGDGGEGGIAGGTAGSGGVSGGIGGSTAGAAGNGIDQGGSDQNASAGGGGTGRIYFLTTGAMPGYTTSPQPLPGS